MSIVLLFLFAFPVFVRRAEQFLFPDDCKTLPEKKCVVESPDDDPRRYKILYYYDWDTQLCKQKRYARMCNETVTNNNLFIDNADCRTSCGQFPCLVNPYHAHCLLPPYYDSCAVFPYKNDTRASIERYYFESGVYRCEEIQWAINCYSPYNTLNTVNLFETQEACYLECGRCF